MNIAHFLRLQYIGAFDYVKYTKTCDKDIKQFYIIQVNTTKRHSVNMPKTTI